MAVHGTEINGQVVKCSWGKEPNESSPTSSPTQMLTPATLQSVSRLKHYYYYILLLLLLLLQLLLLLIIIIIASVFVAPCGLRGCKN